MSLPVKGRPLGCRTRASFAKRLTSLFQALFMGQPVLTRDARDKPIRRWYYIDIRKALDPDSDREEAIVGLPEDRVLCNFRGEPLPGRDYSTTEKECAAEMLPLPLRNYLRTGLGSRAAISLHEGRHLL
jgi:hypothetical protein